MNWFRFFLPGWTAIFLFLLPQDGKFVRGRTQTSVDVYKEKYFEGNKTILLFTQCSSNLSSKLNFTIRSINTRSNCVNLYESHDCSGEFSIVAPGSPIHYDLTQWMGSRSVHSIGPCHHRCDVKSVEPPKHGTDYFVTLYDEAKYRGPHSTLALHNSSGCVPLPLNIKGRISSLKIHGNFCVEIHHNWKCEVSRQEDYAPLRPGFSGSHENLAHWVGHNDMAKAISLCGFGCDKPAPKSKESGVSGSSTIKEGHKLSSKFIIFDEPNFEGNFRKSYSLEENKCANIDYDWDGQIQSCLNTFDNCVVVYDDFNCKSSSYGRNLTIPGNSNSSIAVGADLRTRNFTKVIQSMKLCTREEKARSGSIKGTGNNGSGRGVGFSFMLVFTGMILSALLIFGAAYANYKFQICPTIGQRLREREGHSLIL